MKAGQLFCHLPNPEGLWQKYMADIKKQKTGLFIEIQIKFVGSYSNYFFLYSGKISKYLPATLQANVLRSSCSIYIIQLDNIGIWT